MKIDKEVENLFKQVRVALGAPIRQVELTDDQLCTLLEMCVGDYAEKVQGWLIEVQWATLYGKNVSNTDMAYALTTRTMDLSNDYSYWFSKEVGLQQRGNGKWELKKDYITVEQGKQSYLIPAGREINKIMYVNPPLTQAALFANYGGLDLGFAGGFAQLGGAYGPIGGFYTAPAADIAYLATDMTFKNRLLRGDLTYKVTAGPDGTHILHLYSTPGSRLSFGHMGGIGGALGLVGCEVWYTYYDVTKDNVDDCRRDNPEVLITPDQVPLEKMDYALMNEQTKPLIRQMLVAKAKETLGIIRGTYSGKLMIPNAEMQLDYMMLINMAQQEYQRALDALKERLEKLRPSNILEEQAKIVQQMKEIQKGKPLGIMVI